MQINPVNQATDLSFSVRGVEENPKILEAAAKTENKPSKRTTDQIEVKDASPISDAKTSIEQNTVLKFSRDRQTNELIVELVNAQTGESLRQTPSEVSLKLSAIYSGMQGKLVNKNY